MNEGDTEDDDNYVGQQSEYRQQLMPTTSPSSRNSPASTCGD